MTSPTWADRVQEIFSTTGTGTYSLGGAVTGYQAFSAVMSDTGTCYYCASDGTNWEIGLGTYATSGNTLARTTILASSNSNSAVSWAAGTKNIWLNFPAAQIPGPSPIATNSVAGIVKPDGIIITVSGSGAITVPQISSTTFGVGKVDGTTITASSGVITAAPQIMTAFAVGALATLGRTTTAALVAGTSYSASVLQAYYISTGGAAVSGDSLSGTWLALTSNGSNANTLVLMQRTA